MNPRTIATDRVHHLNAHGALREIDGLIDLVRDGIVGHSHLLTDLKTIVCISMARNTLYAPDLAVSMPLYVAKGAEDMQENTRKNRITMSCGPVAPHQPIAAIG